MEIFAFETVTPPNTLPASTTLARERANIPELAEVSAGYSMTGHGSFLLAYFFSPLLHDKQVFFVCPMVKRGIFLEC